MPRKLLLLAAMLVLLSLVPLAPAAAQTTARCFPETGYCIDGAIRAYWERNGGLPIFGFPIGPLQVEEVRDEQFHIVFQGPVQWFERDRLEAPDGAEADHQRHAQLSLDGRAGRRQRRPPP